MKFEHEYMTPKDISSKILATFNVIKLLMQQHHKINDNFSTAAVEEKELIVELEKTLRERISKLED